VQYVDAREGEPFTMESLCMECLQNVSGTACGCPAQLPVKGSPLVNTCFCRGRRPWCSQGSRTSGRSCCAPSSASTAATGTYSVPHQCTMCKHTVRGALHVDGVMHAAGTMSCSLRGPMGRRACATRCPCLPVTWTSAAGRCFACTAPAWFSYAG
jgi:hypothetical protein